MFVCFLFFQFKENARFSIDMIRFEQCTLIETVYCPTEWWKCKGQSVTCTFTQHSIQTWCHYPPQHNFNLSERNRTKTGKTCDFHTFHAFFHSDLTPFQDIQGKHDFHYSNTFLIIILTSLQSFLSKLG